MSNATAEAITTALASNSNILGNAVSRAEVPEERY